MARLRVPPRWRTRRVLVPVVVAVVSLSVGGVLAFTARDEEPGDAGGGDGGAPAMASTTVDAGDIVVEVPEGWTSVPVPSLGFGVAVPAGWEAVVLSEEGLATIERSSPVVPGFVDAAHAAVRSGSVLYAAGADDQDRVTDLKVRAAPEPGVEDTEGLVGYAEDLAADADLADPTVAPVEDAARPTVRIAFTAQATSADGSEVAVTGTETLVLGPRRAVWSVIVTSEVPEVHDSLAPRIAGTLTFGED